MKAVRTKGGEGPGPAEVEAWLRLVHSCADSRGVEQSGDRRSAGTAGDPSSQRGATGSGRDRTWRTDLDCPRHPARIAPGRDRQTRPRYETALGRGQAVRIDSSAVTLEERHQHSAAALADDITRGRASSLAPRRTDAHILDAVARGAPGGDWSTAPSVDEVAEHVRSLLDRLPRRPTFAGTTPQASTMTARLGARRTTPPPPRVYGAKTMVRRSGAALMTGATPPVSRGSAPRAPDDSGG